MTAPVRTSGRRTSSRVETKAQLTERLEAEMNNVELLRESIAELQLAMDDVGWQRLVAAGEREFTRDGLRAISAACQLFAIKNPLIRRGLILRQAYVWGQGVEVTARANGKRHEGEQDVNAVLQAFLDDPGNRRAMFGAEAQQRTERALGTDGNLFISLWTKPTTGRVQVRILPWDEITDVITNPDDASEPWYYRRSWQQQTIDPATAVPRTELRVALYPAIGYRPKTRQQSFGNVKVNWDAPVRHIKVNDLQGWSFGVPDAYAAVDWARAYKDFLEDWARLVKSLSRYAWRTTAAGSKQAAQIRSKMAVQPTRNPVTGEGNDVGATAILGDNRTLEAIPKTGATIDSESGRPLAMMIAAGLGIPVTMLLADPGQTGARATAETLDQPTQLEMGGRRQLWTDVLRDIAEYVIREAVRAPKGALKGVVQNEDDRETAVLAADTEPSIDIVWPPFDDLNMTEIVEAVTKAQGTGTIPADIIARLLLTALGVRQVDELVDAMTGEDGEFLWPATMPLSSGSDAADRDRDGDDPAAAGTGPMTPDGEPDDGDDT